MRRRHRHLPGLLLAVLGALAAGCGRFTPPEEAPRGQDLLDLAREAVRALRDRDYQLLYPLCSTAYRRARSYDEFLARNRAAETEYRLETCHLDPAASRIQEDHAVLFFDTAFRFPEGSPVERLPRRLLTTFIREQGGWRLHDVLSLPAAPAAASPPPPAPGSSPPPPPSRP